jgi:hypothetical protein
MNFSVLIKKPELGFNRWLAEERFEYNGGLPELGRSDLLDLLCLSLDRKSPEIHHNFRFCGSMLPCAALTGRCYGQCSLSASPPKLGLYLE